MIKIAKPDWIDVILLIVPLAASVMSLLYKFQSLSHADMFSRSGAIMITAGIILLLRYERSFVSELQRAIDSAGAFQAPWGRYVSEEKKYIEVIAYIYMVVGTVISGYGDVIISSIT